VDRAGIRGSGVGSRKNGLADVVKRADVRVRERGNRAGFALEACASVRVCAQFRRENLDGNRAIQAGVVAL